MTTDEDGYKSVDYSKLTAFLIQVNKEQEAKIQSLEQKLVQTDDLKNQLQATNERLEKLEALLMQEAKNIK